MNYMTETKIINGHEYSVTKFPARMGFKLQLKLGKLLLPLVSSFIGGKGSANDIMNSEVNLEKILGALVDRLDEEHVEKLMFQLLSLTRRDNREVKNDSFFDEMYSGNYGELLEALVFIVSINFGNLFKKKDTGTDE